MAYAADSPALAAAIVAGVVAIVSAAIAAKTTRRANTAQAELDSATLGITALEKALARQDKDLADARAELDAYRRQQEKP